MVEIFETHRDIEQELKPKVDISLIKKKTKAYTFRGYLQGLIAKARHDKNKELEVLFDEMLLKFNKFYPDKVIKIVIIEGWKKENGYFPVWKDVDDDYLVEIWHKEQKEIKKVPAENLNSMLRVIRRLELNKEYSCYDIAEKMGYEWKEVWKERMEIYFPLYYIPLKILNELQVVKYGGNHKTIVKLRDK